MSEKFEEIFLIVFNILLPKMVNQVWEKLMVLVEYALLFLYRIKKLCDNANLRIRSLKYFDNETRNLELISLLDEKNNEITFLSEQLEAYKRIRVSLK